MGFYLPPTLRRGEGVPDKKQCREEVFGEMVERCVLNRKGSEEVSAVGARNVKVLPGEGSTGEGLAEGRGRFLMAAGRLG